MQDSMFFDLSLITVIAVTVSYFMKLLKQPLIIGYILVGLIVSITGLIQPSGTMETLSQVGVAILLFMVGLHLNPKIIKDVGKVALITGVGQVIFTSIIGFGLCYILGFDKTTSLYIAIAMTFSSTIVIMKLLSDKGDLGSLYGKISMGFLIVQDIIAMLILMFISFSSGGGSVTDIVLQVLIKGIGLIGAAILVGIYILPKIIKKIAESQEFLELFALGRCFLLASLFHIAGFSIEIGALIAGVTLSMSPYKLEISSKMKSLRDFFIVIFFVLFGTHMSITNIGVYLPAIIILSLFILIGNPIIVITLMGMLGYTKKTSFKAGLTVAQISEFSFILVILGANVGHINKEILSLVTMIGLITIAGSTYFILYSDQIFKYIEKYLSFFEKKTTKNEFMEDSNHEILLFGYDKIGFETLHSLEEMGEKYLVIDYNPEVVKHLEERGVSCKYGDATDVEFLDEIISGKTKMIVSTLTDDQASFLIIKKFKHTKRKCIVITTSHNLESAIKMYQEGADYVILPHFIGGMHISGLIKEYEFNQDKFLQQKTLHLKKIEEIKTYRNIKIHQELLFKTLQKHK